MRRARTPVPEEYSRVTNPERFQPVHAYARELLRRLDAEFVVHRSETFELLPGRTWAFESASPPVTLTPADAAAAPIAIAFTTFPSLVVRCGHWCALPFPSCGCDGCAATAAGEAERLAMIIGHVVAGHFAEAIHIPWFGAARLVHSFSGDGLGEASLEQWTNIPRAIARELAGTRPRRVQWQPWPRAADRGFLERP